MDDLLVPLLMSLGAACLFAAFLSGRQGNDRRDLRLMTAIGSLLGGTGLVALSLAG